MSAHLTAQGTGWFSYASQPGYRWRDADASHPNSSPLPRALYAASFVPAVLVGPSVPALLVAVIVTAPLEGAARTRERQRG